MDDDRDAPRHFVEHGFDKRFALVARAEEAFAGGTGQIQPLRAVLDELGGQRAGAGEIQRLVFVKGRNHRGNDAPNVFHGKVAHKPVSLCVVVYTVRLICGKVNP